VLRREYFVSRYRKFGSIPITIQEIGISLLLFQVGIADHGERLLSEKGMREHLPTWQERFADLTIFDEDGSAYSPRLLSPSIDDGTLVIWADVEGFNVL
jgi:hypothetical protein